MRRLVWFLVCLLFASKVVAENLPLSLQDISKIRQIISISMSPDGENVAFIMRRPREVYRDSAGENWRELYVANKQGNVRPYILDGSAIGQLQWSQNNKRIWLLAKKPNDLYIGIYAIPLDGGGARKIISHQNDILGFSINSDETKALFWGNEKPAEELSDLKKKGFNAHVYEEDIKINKLWLADFESDDKPIRKIFQDEHVINAQFQTNGKYFFIQSAVTSLVDDITLRKNLGVYDQTGELITQFQHLGKMTKAIWSPNGKRLAIIGSNDKNDPSEGRLLIASIDHSGLTDLLPDLPGHVEDIAWLSNSKVAFVAHQGTSSYLASKRIESSRSPKKLISQVGIISKLSSNKKGDEIALIASTSQHPKEVFWYDSKRVRRLTESNPWLEKRQFGKQESISYTSQDGLKLEGILVTPQSKSNTPLPLIIFVHGGPESHISDGWLNRYSHPAHVAANLGYVSFFPNYRGSTGRGVDFSKLGQNDYAGKEFTDILDAKKFLVDVGIADPKRVGISGASYGGYASAWAATKQSEHFAASVATMAIGNQISKFGTTDISSEMYQLHSLQWPWEDWQWMLERSPIYHAEKSVTPLLLMHGELDTRVHVSQSIELYRYMKRLGKAPVRLVLYPDEGHGFRRASAQLDYSMRLMRWMDHFLLQSNTTLPEYQLPHPVGDLNTASSSKIE